jgi:hypothetical protein
LCEAGEPPHHAYLPHNIIISLVAVMEDGHSSEMSMFASTGVMGLAAATVTNLALGHCVVHVTGTTSQINIDTIHSFIEALMVRVL